MLDKKLAKVEFDNLNLELQKIKSAADFFGPNGLMKRMMKTALETLLESEMSEHLGYEKSATEGHNTGNSRNGRTSKKVRSLVGEVELEIPRDRNASFEPLIIPKHQKNVGVLDQQIISMYAKGMTTRDISTHLETIYGLEVSPTFISTTTEKVMEAAKEWQARALASIYAIIYFDAIHYHVRENGKVVSKATYICLGIDLEGKKDVLGIWVGEAEGAHFWMTVFSELKARGVSDILIACMDGLKGLPEALRTIFPNAVVQLCIVHMIRNSLKYVGNKHKTEFIKDLKRVYEAVSLKAARHALDELNKRWMKIYAQAVMPWNTHWEDVSAYFSYPAELRKIMYTTNAIESLNRQMRKVTKNRAILSNDEALFKLLYLAIQDIQVKWKYAIRDWGAINAQLAVLFKDRLELK